MAKGNMGLAGKLAAGIAAGVTILSLYSGIAKAQETEASNAASETISFSIMPSDTSSLDSFVSFAFQRAIMISGKSPRDCRRLIDCCVGFVFCSWTHPGIGT